MKAALQKRLHSHLNGGKRSLNILNLLLQTMEMKSSTRSPLFPDNTWQGKVTGNIIYF